MKYDYLICDCLIILIYIYIYINCYQKSKYIIYSGDQVRYFPLTLYSMSTPALIKAYLSEGVFWKFYPWDTPGFLPLKSKIKPVLPKIV